MVAKRIGTVRKFATRVLAAGGLLALYAVGTVAVTGSLLTATVSSAEAQDRGRGGGDRARGHHGRGHRVCHHVHGTSRRTCRWVW
jgi:hypothetical protein